MNRYERQQQEHDSGVEGRGELGPREKGKKDDDNGERDGVGEKQNQPTKDTCRPSTKRNKEEKQERSHSMGVCLVTIVSVLFDSYCRSCYTRAFSPPLLEEHLLLSKRPPLSSSLSSPFSLLQVDTLHVINHGGGATHVHEGALGRCLVLSVLGVWEGAALDESDETEK